MLKLLVRDFRVVRWDLWLLAAIYAVMAIPASRHAQALFVVGVALAIVLVVAVPGLEWMFDTDRFVCSLPVSRATLVLGRYLSAFVAVALGLAVWMGSAALLSRRFAGADPNLSQWVSLDGAVAYCVILTLVVALFLPCYFRYGLGKGAAVFAVGVMALGGVLAGLRWIVRAALGNVAPDLTAVDLDAARTLARFIWIAIVAAIATGSAALSVRFHRRREF